MRHVGVGNPVIEIGRAVGHGNTVGGGESVLYEIPDIVRVRLQFGGNFLPLSSSGLFH